MCGKRESERERWCDVRGERERKRYKRGGVECEDERETEREIREVVWYERC